MKENSDDSYENELWSEGSYIKPINRNDPDFQERMKYRASR